MEKEGITPPENHQANLDFGAEGEEQEKPEQTSRLSPEELEAILEEVSERSDRRSDQSGVW